MAILVLLGCADAREPRREATVRDSAGIRIVVNPDAPLPLWQVSEEPILSIGSVSGEDGQDLALPWSSVRLSDGRIAVANARTNELRFYDPAGSFIRSVGGSGEGPGEFGVIALLQTFRGDSIIAADATVPRLTVFDSAGAYGRTVPLGDLEGRLPRFRGLLVDDVGLYRVPYFQRGGRTQAVRDTFLMALRPFDGDWLPIGRFPADERFNQRVPSGGVAAWNLPFGRSVTTAVGHGVAWIGVTDRYEIRAYDRDGRLTRVLRMDRTPRPVTDELRSRFFAYEIESAEDEDQLRMRRSVHDIIEFPPTLPEFSAIHLDSQGRLWVQDYPLPWEAGPTRWRVFESDGRAEAMVDLPAGLQVQQIGENYVRGLWRDELGVEYIRAYAILRPDEGR